MTDTVSSLQAGIPVISLHDSTLEPLATSIDPALHTDAPSSPASTYGSEGCSMAGFTDVLQRHAEASGVVPQLALNMGRCSMDSAMGFALSDFAFSVRTALACSCPAKGGDACHQCSRSVLPYGCTADSSRAQFVLLT